MTGLVGGSDGSDYLARWCLSGGQCTRHLRRLKGFKLRISILPDTGGVVVVGVQVVVVVMVLGLREGVKEGGRGDDDRGARGER